MSDAFLSPADVKRLTGKPGGTLRRWNAQAKVLVDLGFKVKQHFIVAATGEPLVKRAALDADGKPAQRGAHRWDRIGSVRQLRP